VQKLHYPARECVNDMLAKENIVLTVSVRVPVSVASVCICLLEEKLTKLLIKELM